MHSRWVRLNLGQLLRRWQQQTYSNSNNNEEKNRVNKYEMDTVGIIILPGGALEKSSMNVDLLFDESYEHDGAHHIVKQFERKILISRITLSLLLAIFISHFPSISSPLHFPAVSPFSRHILLAHSSKLSLQYIVCYINVGTFLLLCCFFLCYCKKNGDNCEKCNVCQLTICFWSVFFFSMV